MELIIRKTTCITFMLDFNVIFTLETNKKLEI